MINNLPETIGGIILIILGVGLILISDKKCLSTFCRIKDGPSGKIKDRDATSVIIGILLALLGLLIILM